MGEMNFKNRGELVYETLKQEILDLRLKPGQMISENDICERFGVSRTPVRDALRLLQEQGFAETIPYRGTSEPGQHQADDIYARGRGNHGAQGFPGNPDAHGHGGHPPQYCAAEGCYQGTGF